MSEQDVDEEKFQHMLELLGEEARDDRMSLLDKLHELDDLMRRVVVAKIRAKEEFLAVPGLEQKVTEDGVIMVPNKAMRALFEVPADLVDEAGTWERPQVLRNLLNEKDALANAWANFGWKKQKDIDPKVAAQKLRLKSLRLSKAKCQGDKEERLVRKKDKDLKPRVPRITNEEREILSNEDKAPDPERLETYRTKAAGAWVVYDNHEREHYELNKLNRAHLDVVMYEPDRLTGRKVLVKNLTALKMVEEDSLNSDEEITLRDDLDMPLPGYPVHSSDPRSYNQFLDDLGEMHSKYPYGDYNVATENDRDILPASFCDWLKERGGKERLWDLADNVRYYADHSPRSSAKPIIMLKAIKAIEHVWSPEPSENGQILAWHERTQEAYQQEGQWFFDNDRGKPYRLNTDWIENRLHDLLVRAVHPRSMSIRMGTLSLIGWDTSIPKFETVHMPGRELRKSWCSHCARRAEEDETYVSIIQDLKQMGFFTTVFRESGSRGVMSLFARDNVDCRFTQNKLLGDYYFNSQDTWKMKGVTGNWACLLCGRSKVFEAFYASARFNITRFAKHVNFSDNTRGLHAEHKTWCALFRIAGENYLEELNKLLK